MLLMAFQTVYWVWGLYPGRIRWAWMGLISPSPAWAPRLPSQGFPSQSLFWWPELSPAAQRRPLVTPLAVLHQPLCPTQSGALWTLLSGPVQL